MEDDKFPQIKFFNQTQSKQLKPCKEDQEVVMDDVGVTLSVPVGAIPEGESFSLQVRPVAYGNIEMPVGCVSHSPLFILSPLHFHKQVKITVEHSCNIECDEDVENLLFLGLDSMEENNGKISCKLKKIEDVEVNFRPGDQKCEIFLKDLQSLRVGRQISASEKFEGKVVCLWWHGELCLWQHTCACI